MSATNKFRSLDSGVTDIIGQFAKEKGIPTVVFPTEAPAKPEAPPAKETVTTLRAEKPKRKAADLTHPAPIKRVTLELPNYLVDDVKAKALKNESTVRFIIVDALRDKGFFVAEVDHKKDLRGER